MQRPSSSISSTSSGIAASVARKRSIVSALCVWAASSACSACWRDKVECNPSDMADKYQRSAAGLPQIEACTIGAGARGEAFEHRLDRGVEGSGIGAQQRAERIDDEGIGGAILWHQIGHSMLHIIHSAGPYHAQGHD